MSEFDVAIVGATGAVGEVMLEILEARDFPVRELYLLASERSEGTKLQFRGKSVTVQNLMPIIPLPAAQISLLSSLYAQLRYGQRIPEYGHRLD